MAKGGKHGLLHHERLLGSLSNGHDHHPSASAADLPDLLEDDVWSAMHGGGGGGAESGGEESWYGGDPWRPSGGGGVGARAHDRRAVGGLSLAFDGASGGAPPRVIHQCRNADSSASWNGGHRHRHAAASAPMTVPVWPGAHRGDPADSPPGHSDECDDGGGEEWVPPHEYLAKECAASSGGGATAGSVFEGVGRTLKGRDLRRLRDAVWSQTGFYG